MALLSLKPTHKTVEAYYDTLLQYGQLNIHYERAVQTAFQHVLENCAAKFRWTLVPEFPLKGPKGNNLKADGALRTPWHLTMGIWEAKDDADDLDKEVKRKFEAGYPKKNILFQAPSRAILYQHQKQVLDVDLTKPPRLVEVVKQFFDYTEPAIDEWEQAVPAFTEKVPELAAGLIKLIEKERKQNKLFISAFTRFMGTCRQSINPDLTESAVEKMLVQHLLTERIFRKVFDNSDFANKNVIAHEIEAVIGALTSNSFSRQAFSQSLDYIYRPLENIASTIEDFNDKQGFLNTVYERFFQSFDAKVADTHGIVYTPQPIVKFMVQSVEDILQKEFGKSLSDKGVHILDPFVGTGNFIVHVMQAIKKSALPYKYEHELHCNEVMLLPYYIASLNIEHEFAQLTGKYLPFDGACLVDTFELAEDRQKAMLSEVNTQRVETQKAAPIFVVIGNPPYNSNQQNEMDLNKNRQHGTLDDHVKKTYIAASKSVGRTTRKLLFDPYVKAFRYATDSVLANGEGIVAFVSNNSFVEQRAFDGVRKHLQEEFDDVYILDLGGNVRRNTKLSGSTHNVFGIQVGVSINLLIRKHSDSPKRSARVFYARLDEYWRGSDKLAFLSRALSVSTVEWQELKPDDMNSWITEGLDSNWLNLLPLGSRDVKAGKGAAPNTLFGSYALGVSTNRDHWLYNDNPEALDGSVKQFCDTYNAEMDRWIRHGKTGDAAAFVTNIETSIKWSSLLLDKFRRLKRADYVPGKVRRALYRPFCQRLLYFDKTLIDAPTLQSRFFPSQDLIGENFAISISDAGHRAPFNLMMTGLLSDLHLCASSDGFQCFPFYIYDDDGANRRENITDWSLNEFRTRYKDPAITKWDIFHYVYALLHHPVYRERYAANLKRELPRVPLAPDFHGFARAGERLAKLHVEYEKQPEFPLERIENPKAHLSYRVEKMKLSKDKTILVYNDFLTLSGIPPEVFEYRLGNRSALEWIVDQYQVSTDARSGIENDPNRLDDEEYIVRLIGQVIFVSLETVKIVRSLPDLGLDVAIAEGASGDVIPPAGAPPARKRKLGQYAGRIQVADDFDAPLDDLADQFEGVAREPHSTYDPKVGGKGS